MARFNMPNKVQARREGALSRFKVQPSRKGVRSMEEAQAERDRLREIVRKGVR